MTPAVQRAHPTCSSRSSGQGPDFSEQLLFPRPLGTLQQHWLTSIPNLIQEPLTPISAKLWISCRQCKRWSCSAVPELKVRELSPESLGLFTQEQVRPGLCSYSWVTQLSPAPFSSLNYPGWRQREEESHQHLFVEKTAESWQGRMRKKQRRDTKHSKTNAHFPAQCAAAFLATRVTWINFPKENRLSQQQPDGLSNSLYNYSLNYLDLIIQEESHCHW